MAAVLRSRILTGFQIANCRHLTTWKLKEDYENVDIDVNQRKLAILERQPIYPSNVRPPKVAKELGNIRGPETVNNRLLYKQFGIMTLCGGWLRSGHIDMMRLTINKKLETRTSFAAWRIDPPYKPITKKGLGKRMGKGKGAIDHYVTPVKAGRILLEVGGTLEFAEIAPLLQEICYKLPVDAIPVSQKILDKIEAHRERIKQENVNPFSMKRVIDDNMHGSDLWVGKYDKLHYGDYI